MSRTTLARQAVEHFTRTDTIPDLGQRRAEGMGPGTVHIFPDGSVACHWTDGAFLEASIEEE